MPAGDVHSRLSVAGRPGGGYLPTLDGWRAIAILMVLCAHGSLSFFRLNGPHYSGRFQGWGLHGIFGVDIFFAISGFLICTRLLREQGGTGRIDLRSFYIRRAFRILPPYLAYLAIISLAALSGAIIVTRSELIASLLFVRNYLPAIHTRDIGWYTGHFWSLAVEEHFYLIWPAVLLIARRRRALMAGLLIILAIDIWRTLCMQVPPLSSFTQIFEQRTDVRLDSLLWGCVLATLYTSKNYRRFLDKCCHPACWTISVIGLLVMSSRTDALSQALRPPLFAVLVVATVVHPTWFVSRFLEDARLRWIGRISYSLYIWQQPFLIGDLISRPLPLGRWQEVPLALVAIFACAIASYYLIEKPLIRLGHRLTPRQAAASASSNSESASAVMVSATSAA